MAFLRSAATGLLSLTLARAVSAVPFDTRSNSTDGPKLGAVASETDICSHIGIKLLEEGGNAIDAMVGTTFCVGE